MAASEMTSRERWEAVLRREPTDRVPTDYWATPEATAKLVAFLELDSPDEIYARLHIDRVITVGPRYVGPELMPGTDVYGCVHRTVEYDTGEYSECVVNPLTEYETVDEIEASYVWPKSEWWDYSHISAQVDQFPENPIKGGGSEPFLTYCKLRGLQQAFMDLILKPDIVHYCLDKLFGLCYEQTERILEEAHGQVLFSYVAEDMGSQESLMFSPAQIHEFLLPRMKRMMDLVHSAGAYVFHHSDGAVRPILPTMIDAGIDVLNPVQWRCTGMEREDLKQDFGDQVVFHGAVDNQQTLPFGTTEDVRQEVIDNLRILGENGGYILAPCHNIQAVGPAENVVVMYETAYEFTAS